MSPAIMVVECTALCTPELLLALKELSLNLVELASSVAAASRALASYHPDLLLICAAAAPDSPSMEAARRLRAASSAPVIFVADRADPHAMARVEREGPYSFHLTPIRPGSLRVAISLALARHALDHRARLRLAR